MAPNGPCPSQEGRGFFMPHSLTPLDHQTAMTPNFRQFLATHRHPEWMPVVRRAQIGIRGTDPCPDLNTPKCRVVDHTQAFRRRFAKTTANHSQ